MKVVLLAGGLGTRISEESHLKPKPMIEIGGKPILWHIMKIYSSFGFNDFIICLGYKGYVIKEFFSDYYLHMSDITFDFSNNNSMTIHNNSVEPWRVTLVDTGLETQTAGRIKKIEKYVSKERFFLTYGDGVSDINIDVLLKEHIKSGKIATLTTVKPDGRFGLLEINEDNTVENFQEKAVDNSSWINGGFMVLEPRVFEYISEDDKEFFEKEPLKNLAHDGQLYAYKHHGFWKCMDTQRDKFALEDLWKEEHPPWKLWK